MNDHPHGHSHQSVASRSKITLRRCACIDTALLQRSNKRSLIPVTALQPYTRFRTVERSVWATTTCHCVQRLLLEKPVSSCVIKFLQRSSLLSAAFKPALVVIMTTDFSCSETAGHTLYSFSQTLATFCRWRMTSSTRRNQNTARDSTRRSQILEYVPNHMKPLELLGMNLKGLGKRLTWWFYRIEASEAARWTLQRN